MNPVNPLPSVEAAGSLGPEGAAESGHGLGPASGLAIAALIGLTLAAYSPVWNAAFIWDDDEYVTDNLTLRDGNGLQRIWFDRHSNPQYYPLVHSSFWVEHHLWGPRPRGYHLINVLLHAMNAVLIGLLLRRLAVPGAFWAAALFAVHPVEVESVAWITERKNVLSTFFYLCSFLAFLRFWPPEISRPRPDGRWHWYALALLLFACALFSKTVACSLPAALLLVRWYTLGSLSLRDWLITAPLFALGLVLGLNTAILEAEHVGARGADWDFSPLERCLIAGRALWFYAGKLIWPLDLMFIYPRWTIDAGAWWQYLYPVSALGVIGVLAACRDRLGRGPLVAVLFFAGTLVPALGFFNVYPMRFSFVADHFQYLASVGLLAILAAGAVHVLHSLAGGARARTAKLAGAISVVVLLAVLTWRQCGAYVDAETLYQTTLDANPDCWMAHINLGMALAGRGQVDDAIMHFRKALEIKPDDALGYVDLATTLTGQGQVDEAIVLYRKALDIKPNYALAHNNLGAALAGRGQFNEAVVHYRKALDIKPDYADAHYNLGNVLTVLGQFDEAIAHYRKSLDIKPEQAEAHNNLGNVLARQGQGQVDEAIAHFRKAVDIKPNYALAHNNLAAALSSRGHVHEAIAHYRKAVAIKPDYATAHFNLALALAGRGQGDEAIVHFRKAVAIKPDYAAAHYNLALALAARGQVGEAIVQFRKAGEILADVIRARIGNLAK
jgi:protein O-mannosyl-transferase